MMTLLSIQQLSIKLQTTELNIKREYFQHLLMSYLYQQPESDKLLFKGGTALRMVYESPRFSEDLDFSTKITSKTYIEDLLLKTLSQMEKEGVRPNLTEAKPTTGGYLSKITFSGFEQPTDVMIQISLRPSQPQGKSATISNFYIPPYTIIAYGQKQLTGEKIQALLNRKKPRDFYDLYFMLRARLLSQEDKEKIEEIIPILTKTKIDFHRELKTFLPRSHWPVIKDFKKILLEELKRV